MSGRSTFSIGGVETVVDSVGRGHPVLFLHGASTLEGFDFADGLADRFQMLLPSHPGFGASGDAAALKGMSEMVVHYLDLLDAMSLDRKPHLVGFSMGGWLEAELAGVARERFERVVFVAPAGLVHPEHPPTPLDAIAPRDFPSYLAHDVSVALRYFPDPSRGDDAAAFGAAREREGRALANILAPHGMGHPNLVRWIRRITNPALVVWGEEDRLIPVETAALWEDALPDVRVERVPGAGHFVLQESPRALATIADFLRG